MKVYYAHCLALYGTTQEARDLQLLWSLSPMMEIVNPNQPFTQEECERAKAAGQEVMETVFKPMVQDCALVAFRALPDGSIPSGVAKEIEWALQAGLGVIELPSAISKRTLSLQATREYLREVGQR